MSAYYFGETIGAAIGMVLIGSGLAWIIRKLFRQLDFQISVGVAMLLLTVVAGITNSSGRPYALTITLYGIAAIVAYFIVTLAQSRQRPYTPLSQPPVQSEQFGIDNVSMVPRERVVSKTKPTSGVAWGRGFFRVWMLVAALWVIVMGAILWSSVANPYVPGKNVAVNLQDESISLLDSYGDIHWAMEGAVRNGTAKKTLVRYGYELYTPVALEPWKHSEYLQKASVAVADYIRTETVARRSQAIPGVVGWLLIPPVLLLALGWAVGWAISGFRRNA